MGLRAFYGFLRVFYGFLQVFCGFCAVSRQDPAPFAKKNSKLIKQKKQSQKCHLVLFCTKRSFRIPAPPSNWFGMTWRQSSGACCCERYFKTEASCTPWLSGSSMWSLNLKHTQYRALPSVEILMGDVCVNPLPTLAFDPLLQMSVWPQKPIFKGFYQKHDVFPENTMFSENRKKNTMF